MKLQTITDVFFDLDHTLWDFDKNSGLAFQRVFQKNKIDIDLALFLQEYEPINFAYWKLFREEKVTKEQLRRGRLTDAFKKIKREYSLQTIDTLAVSYIEELPVTNHLFEGALELLEYLHSRYKLHIITNGFEEVQKLKLKNSGIAHFFTTVTTSEEAGVKKPNPVIFEKAYQKAGVLPVRSVMIGDSFEADILGAAAAGMNTIFYNYRKEIMEGDHITLHTLAEIKKYL